MYCTESSLSDNRSPNWERFCLSTNKASSIRKVVLCFVQLQSLHYSIMITSNVKFPEIYHSSLSSSHCYYIARFLSTLWTERSPGEHYENRHWNILSAYVTSCSQSYSTVTEESWGMTLMEVSTGIGCNIDSSIVWYYSTFTCENICTMLNSIFHSLAGDNGRTCSTRGWTH